MQLLYFPSSLSDLGVPINVYFLDRITVQSMSCGLLFRGLRVRVRAVRARARVCVWIRELTGVRYGPNSPGQRAVFFAFPAMRPLV